MKYPFSAFNMLTAVSMLWLAACKEAPRPAPDAPKPVASAPATAPAPTTADSFCTSGETIVFNCQTADKRVSVCASRTLSPAEGYVQYRFGKPGAPLELTLPAGEVHPLKAAYGAFDGYSGGGASWIRFRNDNYSYVVYSGIGRWGPKGEPMEKQGVAVEQNGKLVANLKCSSASRGELGPDWLQKAGYTRSDKEAFFIPE
jgi:hypothetical protein